jgi:hypothetical protein
MTVVAAAVDYVIALVLALGYVLAALKEAKGWAYREATYPMKAIGGEGRKEGLP